MNATSKAVFLSYASQDAEAAQCIAAALRAAGAEVWLDQSELVGGDAWDAKIRGQIASCALFVPVISANTQARLEGYFRIEWKLAAQRTHAMAEEKAFLLPVVIDGTRDGDARVPAEFKAVQWTRLPEGETTPAFTDRVRHLLIGGGSETRERLAGAGSETPTRSASRGRRVPWLVPVFAGLAAVAALAIWQPWQKSASPSATAAPLSEARQLTLKARALIDDDLMAGRENFRLAEELCEKAVKLAPDDGEAWATLARVSAEVIRRRYDTTEPRQAAARSQAERAIRLAPESVEAELAMAAYLSNHRELAAAETRLRALLQRAQADQRVALALSIALDDLGKVAEGSALRHDHPALGARNPLALSREATSLRRQDRFVEALEYVERSGAIAPSRGYYLLKLLVLGHHWGDLEAQRAHAEKLPPKLLQEDLFAGLVTDLWLRLGEPGRALEVLRRIPRDFFEESRAIVPKGYLAGRALQLDGRLAAADAEWRAALVVVEKRLAADPNRPLLLRWRALLLALTKQKEEAERAWTLFAEFSRNPAGENSRDALEDDLARAEMLIAVDRVPEAVATIRTIGPLLTHFRYDPWLAPLRRDSRIQAMIAEGMAPIEAQRRRSAPVSAVNVPAAAPAKSVAVLAFKNLSGDRSRDFFSDGLSEAVADVLGRVPGLRVTASASAFSFKDKTVAAPEIARQLGVSHLVEGTVVQDGEKVRITAKLIQADGFQVWISDKLERDVKNIFALHDEVAGLIARQLSLKLGATPAATPIVNPEAFRHYLEGREAWSQRRGRGDADPDVDDLAPFFEKAVAIDPGFARAHASLALVWAGRFQRRLGVAGVTREEGRNRARIALERALSLDSNLSEPHVARASLLLAERNYDGATAAFQRAIELNPNDATAHQWFGEMLFQRGRVSAAIAELEIAARLDPLSPLIVGVLSSALRDTRRWPEALAAADRALRLRANSGEALRVRADALAELGQRVEARSAFQAVEAVGGSVDPASRADQVLRLLRIGDRPAADGLAQTILADPAGARPMVMFKILLALGRVDEAFAEGAQESRGVLSGARLGVTLRPVFDPVRDDPRFAAALEQAGILAEYRAAWADCVAWEKRTGGQAR